MPRRERAAPRGLAGGGGVRRWPPTRALSFGRLLRRAGQRRRPAPSRRAMRAAPGGSGFGLEPVERRDSLPHVSVGVGAAAVDAAAARHPVAVRAHWPESSGNSDGSNRPNSLPSCRELAEASRCVSPRYSPSAAASLRSAAASVGILPACEQPLQLCGTRPPAGRSARAFRAPSSVRRLAPWISVRRAPRASAAARERARLSCGPLHGVLLLREAGGDPARATHRPPPTTRRPRAPRALLRMRSISSSSRCSSSGVISVLLLQLQHRRREIGGDVVSQRGVRRRSRQPLRQQQRTRQKRQRQRNRREFAPGTQPRERKRRGTFEQRRLGPRRIVALEQRQQHALTAVQPVGQRDDLPGRYARLKQTMSTGIAVRTGASQSQRRAWRRGWRRTCGRRAPTRPATSRLATAHIGHTSRKSPTASRRASRRNTGRTDAGSSFM